MSLAFQPVAFQNVAFQTTGQIIMAGETKLVVSGGACRYLPYFSVVSVSIAVINGSECYVSWTCEDTEDQSYTPTSLSYEVWDINDPAAPVVIVASTALTPAATGTFTLDATVNTMEETSSWLEQRQVTVKTGIPGGTFRNDVVLYTLIRQAGTP